MQSLECSTHPPAILFVLPPSVHPTWLPSVVQPQPPDENTTFAGQDGECRPILASPSACSAFDAAAPRSGPILWRPRYLCGSVLYRLSFTKYTTSLVSLTPCLINTSEADWLLYHVTVSLKFQLMLN